MADTVFTAGAGVTPLSFSVNPCYPVRVCLNSGVARGVSEGGTEYAYRKGPLYALHFIRFEGLPSSDYDGGYDYVTGLQGAGTQSLVNWFVNVSQAGSGTFTYTDPFGKARTVSLADDKLEFSLTDKGSYDGAITLKEILS